MEFGKFPKYQNGLKSRFDDTQHPLTRKVFPCSISKIIRNLALSDGEINQDQGFHVGRIL